MTYIHYPKCTTCIKAKKWLNEKGFSYTEKNIKEDNPNFEDLKEWHKKSGLPIKKFFNTSGLRYKALNLKEKLASMTEEEQLQLLATDGMLVKRPLVITDNCVLVGFKVEEWGEHLH
ncbi:MAG: arsenate reductase family protein [Treponemataceae bacterium]